VDGLHVDTVAHWPGSNAWEIWRDDIQELVGVRGGKKTEGEFMEQSAARLVTDPPETL